MDRYKALPIERDCDHPECAPPGGATAGIMDFHTNKMAPFSTLERAKEVAQELLEGKRSRISVVWTST